MVATSVTLTLVHLSHLERLAGPALDLSESPSLSTHQAVLIQEGNSALASRHLHLLICLFIVCLPAKHVHEGRDLYLLFTAVSPEPRTVPDT